SWHPRAGARPPQKPGTIPTASARDGPADETGGFTPRAAIATHAGRPTVSEPRAVVRARLRELPMVYIVMLGIAVFWRRAVLGGADLTLSQVDAALILALVGV